MTKGIWIAIFLLLNFLSGMALAEDKGGRAEEAKDRYEKVTEEIQIKRKRQEHLKETEKSLLDNIDRLAFTLHRRTKELKVLERKLAKTEKSISAQEVEVSRLRGQMAATQKLLETRVAALYKASKMGPWIFLLSAENYGDLLRTLTFLRAMVDHDGRLLTAFEEQLEQEEALQRNLASCRSELQEKQSQVSLKKQEIETLRRRKQRALKEVRKEKTSFAKAIRDLERQAEKLQSMIQTLSDETESDSRRGLGFQAMKGRLPLPVAGKIETEVQRKRKGICLKAPLGAIVQGVYNGRVVYADWFKGYGNLLIVDHGDKFHTVMGHASELLKEKGDWVETGEPVARVGSTGFSGDPSLYFEIRHGGRAINPLEWFSRKDRLALK